jgi:Mg2+-importing ATPase
VTGNRVQPFWSLKEEDLLKYLNASRDGLSNTEAQQRREKFGSNLLKPRKRTDSLSLFLSQFKNSIIIILLCATGISFFLHDPVDAAIILVIIMISAILGFIQERGAAHAVERLLSIVQVRASVLRDNSPQEISVEEVVPGDIVLLKAGDVIPGDCMVLEAKNLHANEAPLTGETFPVDKSAGEVPPSTPLSQRKNILWMGTHVIGGETKAVVVKTGKNTEFGKISEHVRLRPEETEFEHGIRHFGYLLMEVTLILIVIIFAFNVYLARPVMESFLFSLALAVGLTPQLLPAIITINLAHGAKRMADHKVIVKRLASIENFGSMNVLCSDKTGTITEGVVRLKSALDISGSSSESVLFHAYLNSVYETGFSNPIDAALREAGQFDLSGWKKLDEVPYDFTRKRLSILASHEGSRLMVSKGALANVLEVCSTALTPSGSPADIAGLEGQVLKLSDDLNEQGYRTLGVARRDMREASHIDAGDEKEMVFLGILVFYDPPKQGISSIFTKLKEMGVSLKIVTGDSRKVAASLHRQLGLPEPLILTGRDLHEMTDEALLSQAPQADVFAEVEPNQKERIILALKKAGNVVGFMGDGINDASALHASDVGISVDSAADVAKESADIVLLEKDLEVLGQGVRQGRKTFANTLKYVFMATSANFGNMFSMAGASLFLPFLPMLPKQILLTNLLTDFPEMTIAADTVDDVMIAQPHKWNIKFIRSFMITFGIVSSIFDYLTFGVLLLLLHADTTLFRSGWFVESVISASLIVLVVRTSRPFFRSKPSSRLLMATLAVVVVTLVLPYSPLSSLIGFKPLPLMFMAWLFMIIIGYVITAEAAKKVFYRYMKF